MRLLRSPWVIAASFAAVAATPIRGARAQTPATQAPATGPAGKAEAPEAPPAQPPREVTGTPSGPPAPTMRARVLVLPVLLGDGPDPDPLLVTALVRGLNDNPNWDVVSPASGDPLEPVPVPALPASLLSEADSALAAVASARAGNDHAAVVAALDPIMQKMLDALSRAPAGPAGSAVLLKVGGALLTAQIGAGQDEAASATAATLKLLFPGRTLGQAEGFSLVSAALLQATAASGVTASVLTNPKGCRVLLDGHDVGAAPVDLQLRPGTKYSASARCGEGRAEVQSFPRVLTVAGGSRGDSDASAAPQGGSKFVLDAVLPSVLQQNGQGVRLRFSDAEHRRLNEELYIPRVAERFGANNVVLVSVGEFQSSAWLNGRLYLSSGYKNRQGLARMEPARAAALGRYLSTGRESPGVLNAEEAGNMVAAAQTLKPLAPTKVERTPWYKDPAAWSLVGAGALSLSLGIWADGKAEDKRTEADLKTRNDPVRRDRLQSEASSLKFWGSVGIYTGAVLVGTGVFLLVLPEYQETRSSIYGLAPLPGGGGAFTYAGRF